MVLGSLSWISIETARPAMAEPRRPGLGRFSHEAGDCAIVGVVPLVVARARRPPQTAPSAARKGDAGGPRRARLREHDPGTRRHGADAGRGASGRRCLPAEGGRRHPVLYTCAVHNKDLQRPEIAEALPPQPAYASLWYGVVEGGDTKRLVANGYAHVIAELRGVGKSEGDYDARQRDRPLRHDRVDLPAAVVRRQRGHGRHLRVRRRAVPGGGAGAPGPQGHLPLRLHGRLQRHVERPRVPSRAACSR